MKRPAEATVRRRPHKAPRAGAGSAAQGVVARVLDSVPVESVSGVASAEPASDSPPSGRPAGRAVRLASSILMRVTPPLAVLGVAAFVRFWQLTSVGFNSDEAVYAGTAGSIAGDQTLRSMFPVFRAHPVLFQLALSLTGTGRPTDFAARALPAAVGVATVLITYLLGQRLYGRPAGLLAALVLAVMPYHVLVSRQVLLDGPMTLGATVVLYCVARYASSTRPRWLIAAGGILGLTVLTKETSVVLLGGLYAFFALTSAVRIRLRHALLALGVMALVVLPYPLVLTLSGRSGTGQNYLLWQIFRPANHPLLFYGTVVPGAIGPAVLIAVLLGWVWLRRENTWRERLLLCWIAVPVAFFSLWPVKGYQYLLPIAPPLAVLAGRTLSRLPRLRPVAGRRWLARVTVVAATFGTVVSLAVPTWAQVNPAPTGTFLAGTGGLPGGREAGLWVHANVPVGAQLLAVGPSMANVLEYYGGRRVYALSVSPNPKDRNPTYVPVPNPDLALRRGEFQYVVWDSYTADRASFFARQARVLIDKYHGVAVYTATISARAKSGHPVTQPVIVIYQVRAA